MAERPVYLEGRNLGLLLAQMVLWIAVGLLVIGPGRSSLALARGGLEAKLERESRWYGLFGDAEALTPAERNAWQADFDALREFGAPAPDEPELTAWVAKKLRAPSVHGLEVVAESDEEEEEEDGGAAWVVHSPIDSSELELHERRVRVRFDARYPDLSSVLGRIEAEASALALQSLRARREGDRVRIEMELELWARGEDES